MYVFAGLTDVNAQQIDLRVTNSWVIRMHEVSTPELAEVLAINAMAPFIFNARLKPLLNRGREVPTTWKVGVVHYMLGYHADNDWLPVCIAARIL